MTSAVCTFCPTRRRSRLTLLRPNVHQEQRVSGLWEAEFISLLLEVFANIYRIKRMVTRLFQICTAVSIFALCGAFAPVPQPASHCSHSAFFAQSSPETESPNVLTRKEALFGTALLLAGLTFTPPPAQATYSAYTRREEDWQQRVEKKEVQFTSARQLRSQLREIVPQNTESSKIFCPNGPSANVSPLMENKCGDRQAIPSVYGRTEDIVGNSVPGFAGGRYTEQMRGESSSLSAELGSVSYGTPKMRR